MPTRTTNSRKTNVTQVGPAGSGACGLGSDGGAGGGSPPSNNPTSTTSQDSAAGRTRRRRRRGRSYEFQCLLQADVRLLPQQSHRPGTAINAGYVDGYTVKT